LTSGKHLTESEIRAYFKCSSFYNFGGLVEPEIGLKIVQDVIEVLTVSSIRGITKEPLKEIHSALIKAVSTYGQQSNLMEPQVERYLNSCLLWLQDFFEIFSFSTYLPVFGPIEPVIKIDRTSIKLHFAGLYRSEKNSTIHALSFSPYKTKHSIVNDPISILKLELLKPFVKKHFPTNRPQVKLHTFYYGKNHNMGYVSLDSNSIPDNTVNNVESQIINMQNSFHYPVIPCLYSCKYKKTCLPGGINE
jgi:hypothetical protein